MHAIQGAIIFLPTGAPVVASPSMTFGILRRAVCSLPFPHDSNRGYVESEPTRRLAARNPFVLDSDPHRRRRPHRAMFYLGRFSTNHLGVGFSPCWTDIHRGKTLQTARR